MIKEFHKVKVDQTFLGYNQFRIPVEDTIVHDGKHDNLFFDIMVMSISLVRQELG